MPDENGGGRAVAAADTPLAPPSARTDAPSSPPPPPLPVEEEVKDLGFGSVVARESRRRLLNRDGTFNVRRRGIGVLGSISPYHSLLTLSWPKFLGLAALVYAVLNALFAAAYVLCGTDALQGPTGGPAMGAATRAFYVSVETFGTIGYGNIVPVTNAANAIVTIESFAGLITIALATGLVFARFSRPTALIAYSRVALVAPYRGITAFEFRVANRRNTQIIDLGVKVLFTRLEGLDGSKVRRFHELPLERTKVAFFPLAWTVVHPIDARSPLRGLTHADLVASDAEFLVLFTGMDETFSQTVHSRSSYKPDEIVWGAKFADVFNRSRDQEGLSVDIGRLDAYERVGVVPDA